MFYKSDKSKLKDRDYEFCTECHEKEAVVKLFVINIDDGSDRESNLCRECSEKLYPIKDKCECCGWDEEIARVKVKEVLEDDEAIKSLCKGCIERLLDDGTLEYTKELSMEGSRE